MEWKPPRIIIGNTATGAYYYHRPLIEQTIWEEIGKGNHVLLAAPRRVGKSSVMEFMAKHCPEGIKCLFENIQGIQSEQEYYRRFYEMLLRCLDQYGKGVQWLNNLLKGAKIEEITSTGIKFGDIMDFDFATGIKHLLAELGKNDVRVVLFLDELPEVLFNLHKHNRGEEASHILNHLRELRQNPTIRGYFSLVLAGSVGVRHVVKAIEGRINDLNDFNPVPFDPLSRKEAEAYVKWATEESTVRYNEQLTAFLLQEVRHYIPYFINLVLNEVYTTARKNNTPKVSEVDIHTAIERIVKNSDHFREWKNRLEGYYLPQEKAFLNDVLTAIAHEGHLSIRRVYDLSVKHHLQDVFMELIQGLEQDGYIFETEGGFAFISPFLQSFWKRENPVYQP